MIKTAGDLKRALQGIPDDMPLAFGEHTVGHKYRLFAANHRANFQYLDDEEARKPVGPTDYAVVPLKSPVCVIMADFTRP